MGAPAQTEAPDRYALTAATADDYGEHYRQRPLFDPDTKTVQTGAVLETLSTRARLHNPKYSTAATALQAARMAGSKYGLRRFDMGLLWFLVEVMGGKVVEGLGCPAVDDTAGQLADALAVEPKTVRNALVRLGAAGLISYQFGWVRHDGERRWFVAGNRTKGRRVLMPGVVLCAVADDTAALSSSPPSGMSSSPPSGMSSSPPSGTPPEGLPPEGLPPKGSNECVLKAGRVEGAHRAGRVGAASARNGHDPNPTRAISDSCCGRRRTRPSAPPAPPLPRTRGTGPGPRSRSAP